MTPVFTNMHLNSYLKNQKNFTLTVYVLYLWSKYSSSSGASMAFLAASESVNVTNPYLYDKDKMVDSNT